MFIVKCIGYLIGLAGVYIMVILCFIAVILLLVAFLIRLFKKRDKCPRCGKKGIVLSFYDTEIDKMVYECEFCKERFIIM